MEVVESFMQFSFNDEDFFFIENDPLVHDIHKTCEFVVLVDEHTLLIEAKSSAPHPKSKEDFNDFLLEIRQKFEQALSIFVGIKNNEYGEEAFDRLPIHLREVNLDLNSYVLYLIIHGHDDSWMPGLQDSLKEALRDVVAKWQIPDSNMKTLREACLHLTQCNLFRCTLHAIRYFLCITKLAVAKPLNLSCVGELSYVIGAKIVCSAYTLVGSLATTTTSVGHSRPR